MSDSAQLGNQAKMCDVIVVGCGAAGIAAMSRLHREGYHVIGLEAMERIGGRVHSTTVGSSKIDLGAEWCHGEKGNVIYEMAKDCLGRPSEDFTVKFIHSDGKAVVSEVADNFIPLYSDVHELTVKNDMQNSNESLGYHLDKAYWEYVNKMYPDADVAIKKQLHKWFEFLENSLNASDTWFDASGKGHLEYHECEGEHLLHWKGKGFESVLNILMKVHKDSDDVLPLNIQFNKEVTLIEYDSIRYPGVHIKCSDGTEYFSKAVIVTMSLGVLQERYLNLFCPPLPHAKVNSINGLELGTVDKMFLEFDEPWWKDEKDWFGLLWKTDEDKKGFESSWLLDVFAFNACEYNPRVLCGWVVGAAARYMETLSDEVVQAELWKLIQRFFGKLYDVKPPKRLLRSKWYSNKFTRGSYSFRSMESDKTDAWASILAEPIYNKTNQPVLCFAGEATSTHYFSTVHGAIESGFREADRIISARKGMLLQSKF